MTRPAYSSGWPSRLGNGTAAASNSCAFSGKPASSGVLKMPGRIVLMRIPSLIKSRAIGRVMPSTAALLAA